MEQVLKGRQNQNTRSSGRLSAVGKPKPSNKNVNKTPTNECNSKQHFKSVRDSPIK
ncbi:MAG: hypothetical protein ACK521_04325 [bacterium]